MENLRVTLTVQRCIETEDPYCAEPPEVDDVVEKLEQAGWGVSVESLEPIEEVDMELDDE